jgi:drug/metabolite transporter (DMT)-like permease
MDKQTTPIWVWGLLVAALTGVSSAGAILQHLDSVPPLLRASWRLQATSVILAPLAIWQWRTMDHDLRKRVFTPQAQKVIWLSGLALALHFGTWVPSLDKTSLTHSLLFVTAHPLVIVVGMVFLAKIMTNQRSPTSFEVIGAVLGVLGAAITLLDQGDVQGSHTVTAFGDFLAFLGAIFVVGYIVCGKILRSWMPIFIYAFPVTLISSILLIPASFILESSASQFSPFGWIEMQYLPWFLLLAMIGGLLGHTGLNTCLRYMSPLTVSTAVTLEPLLGSLIGWLFFDTGVPGFWTWIGGPILITGILFVIFGTPESDVEIENTMGKVPAQSNEAIQ